MTQNNNRLIFVCLNSDLLSRIDYDFTACDYIVSRKNLNISEQSKGGNLLQYPLKEYISEILSDTCEIDFAEVLILCRDVNADTSYFEEIINFALSNNKECRILLQDIKNQKREIKTSGLRGAEFFLCKNFLGKCMFSIFFTFQFLSLLCFVPLVRIMKIFKKSYSVCIAKRVHSNQSYVLGKALKELSVKAVSVDLVAHPFGYQACDVSRDISKLNAVVRFFVLDFYFIKFLFSCDVFLFENNGESFFVAPLSFDDWMMPSWFQTIEMLILKLFGKKIIFEMRDCTVYDRKDKLQQDIRNICKECDLGRVKAICRKKRYLLANETAVKYADFLFCSTPELKEYLTKETLWLPNGFVLSENKREDVSVKNKSDKIKIIHASSSRGMKGTVEAISAVEILQKKYDIDFILIEKMSHRETIAHIDSADIVLGQLSCGAYGNFEIEAMAHAKPVICYIQEKLYGEVEVPFVNVDGNDIVNSVVAKCEELILNENLRKDYAKRSYDCAIKMHDYKKLGATVKQVIEALI